MSNTYRSLRLGISEKASSAMKEMLLFFKSLKRKESHRTMTVLVVMMMIVMMASVKREYVHPETTCSRCSIPLPNQPLAP